MIVAESPIGFRCWMIKYGLIKTVHVQHELSGSWSCMLTRDLYFGSKARLVAGTRPVPKDPLEIAEREILVADEATTNEKISGVKAR